MPRLVYIIQEFGLHNWNFDFQITQRIGRAGVKPAQFLIHCAAAVTAEDAEGAIALFDTNTDEFVSRLVDA